MRVLLFVAALGGFFVGPVFVNAADPLEQILKSKYLNQLDAKSVKYEKSHLARKGIKPLQIVPHEFSSRISYPVAHH